MAMDTETEGLNEVEERRRVWRERLERQAQSGKTVVAYCTEEGLKPWQFWYWRKALQPKAPAVGGFVELCSRSTAGVVLELAGCRITVARGFDPELLRQVVTALRPG
jgi:hypothetical protein